MVIHVSQLQRVRMYVEPNGSMGTDHSATLEDYYDLPIIEGSIELKIIPANIEKAYLRQNRDEYAGQLVGTQKATLSFEIPHFHPTSRSDDNPQTAIVHSPTTRLLATWLTGAALGTSMTASADSTTSDIKSTSHVANAAEGCGVAVVNAAGLLECRKIVRINSTTMTLDQALSAAPSAGVTLYRGIDLYPSGRTTSAVTTFQFLVEGPDYADDCWLLLGCQCTTAPSFSVANGERATWKMTFEAAKIIRKEALVASFANVTYTNVNEVLNIDSRFTAYAIDTANPYTVHAIGTALAVSEFSFDFSNLKYTAIKSPSGFANVAAYVIGGETPKCTGKFRLPLEVSDETWLDLFASRAPIAVNFQLGSSATYGATLITVQHALITDFQRITTNGIMEQEISWSAKLDSQHYTATSSATELSNAPVKIFVF